MHPYNRTSLTLSGVAASVPGVVMTLASTWATWLQVAVLGLIAAVTLRRSQWIGVMLKPSGGHGPRAGEQAAVLLIAVSIAAAGYESERAHLIAWAMLPGGVVSGMFILRHSRPGWPAWLGAGLAVIAYWAVALTVAGASIGAVGQAFGVTVLVVAAVVLLEHSQVWTWSLLERLEAGRRTAAELAVANERLRFAGDLHDIQGHYLQAMCLKGEICVRLIGVDDQRAREAARDVVTLSRQALDDTRAVVHGYRQTSLELEMENAVGILCAAGIDATVTGSHLTVPCSVAEPLGRLVREGATNILRHTHATACRISLSREEDCIRLSMRNDGVPVNAPTAHPGSGLQGLGERFAEHSGSVTVRQDAEWFEVVGTLPLSGPVPPS